MAPATFLALLKGLPFYAWWLISLLLIPVTGLLLVSVFRSKSKSYRWWVFQYLGVSSIGFSAALGGAFLSLFVEQTMAGQIAVVLFFVFYVIAVRAAHRIHLVPLEISSSKIIQPLRLVQISDVHVGSRKPAFLEKVIKLVEAQKPDILLITGDLIDEDVSAQSLQALASLECPVLYCSGNHERYVDYRIALENIASQGVSLLSDSATVLNGLQILGIEDREHIGQAREALSTLCASNSTARESFRILLYHQPDLWADAVDQGIDLTLSGHTHKGQIWPFGWVVRTRYKHVAGHFRSALCHLFVSQGTGTWGPILRFGTRCEMTVIELRPE